MRHIVCKDYDEVSKKAAEVLLEVVKVKPDAVLGLATGSTPVGLYKELIEAYQNKEVDFGKVTTFNLDEYYGLPRENDQSYYYFMEENLFKNVNVADVNKNIPNGMAQDARVECKRYDDKIEALGGIDIQLLGVGGNGHIGFNEPAEALSGPTHMVTLTDDTIEANARFFASKADVPTKALTLGIKGIMTAKKVLVVACGKAKAQAVKELFSGRITTKCPVTLLNAHCDVVVVTDEEAASLL